MTLQDRDRDRAADRRAFVMAGLACSAGVAAVVTINALSLADEITRSGAAPGLYPYILEGASGAATLMLLPAVLALGAAFPLETGRWRISLAVHLAGLAAFAALHTGLMTGFRSMLWPLLLERPYQGFGSPLETFIYELRKDALTYISFQAVLMLLRALTRARMTITALRREAREGGMIALRCGGREIRLPASEIVSASAAGNYAEIRTQTGSHLARIPLSELETMLAGAGVRPVRLHRSHLAVHAAIREIIPGPDGGAQVRLADGGSLPVSRRYRAGLKTV
ncbi:LytR/AlgR family response regulator transcription factor [Alkalicaulis satelles]|uniref:LytR/AlgR family response regulator transcription factor n=1 Tax=Alkalicaulis satelles TaxID=2609175 RepID=UPI0018EB0392|nr:LytTR family DNA-binding domain-containing protein [Alkalicaulis satelles]